MTSDLIFGKAMRPTWPTCTPEEFKERIIWWQLKVNQEDREYEAKRREREHKCECRPTVYKSQAPQTLREGEG